VVCPRCGHEFMRCDRFHAADTFIIYDLETTGLYSEEDEFIQIAAVRFQSGRLIPEDSFFSFARPRRPISSFIESYTGIGNRHVVGALRSEADSLPIFPVGGRGYSDCSQWLAFRLKVPRRHLTSPRAACTGSGLHRFHPHLQDAVRQNPRHRPFARSREIATRPA
jgi:hypothetical protein